MKILCVGHLDESQVDTLVGKLTAVQASGAGPFDAAFLTGLPSPALLQALAAQPLPLPLYVFMEQVTPSQKQAFSALNLHLLQTDEVIHFAKRSLRLIYAQDGRKSEAALLKHLSSPQPQPLDLLFGASGAEDRLGRCIWKGKPRYVLQTGPGSAYLERSPFRYPPGTPYPGRWLSLAPVASPEKWLYALNYTPTEEIAGLDEAAAAAAWQKLMPPTVASPGQPQPVITPFPFSLEPEGSDSRPLYERFDMKRRGEEVAHDDRSGSQHKIMRRGEDEADADLHATRRLPPSGYVCHRCQGTDHYIRDCREAQMQRGASSRGPPPPSDAADCWFCLGNDKAEKHLVLWISECFYLALTKGGLSRRHHFVLVPIEHVLPRALDWLSSLPSAATTELAQYEKSLGAYFKAKNELPIVFYLTHPAVRHHAHLHVIGLPLSDDSSETLTDKIKAGLLSHAVIADLAHHDTLPTDDASVSSYWHIRIGDQPPFYLVPKGPRYDVQFMRKSLAHSMRWLERLDWKACAESIDQECALVDALRQDLEPFNPFSA